MQGRIVQPFMYKYSPQEHVLSRGGAESIAGATTRHRSGPSHSPLESSGAVMTMWEEQFLWHIVAPAVLTALPSPAPVYALASLLPAV